MRISRQNLRAVTKTALMALLISNLFLVLPTAVLGQANPKTKSVVKAANLKDELSAFLEHPVDLMAFKKRKGPSNSGSCKASPWIYRPKKAGFFYQYRLFVTPTRYSEGERFGGLSIVVYKFGKKVRDYYDSNEMLVAIWCRLNDPDLGRANLVGRYVPELKARFGELFAVVGDILIYTIAMGEHCRFIRRTAL